MIAAIYISGVVVAFYLALCYINGFRNYWYETFGTHYYQRCPEGKMRHLILLILTVFSWCIAFPILTVILAFEDFSLFKPFYKYGKK